MLKKSVRQGGGRKLAGGKDVEGADAPEQLRKLQLQVSKHLMTILHAFSAAAVTSWHKATVSCVCDPAVLFQQLTGHICDQFASCAIMHYMSAICRK